MYGKLLPPPPLGIRRNKDIQGITVGTKEIKLGLFADDLTGLLKIDHSLIKFMELVEAFGECSGLRINLDKSEVMILVIGGTAHYELVSKSET